MTKDEKTIIDMGNPFENVFERIGEDNSILPCSEEELERRYQQQLQSAGVIDTGSVSKEMKELLKDMLRDVLMCIVMGFM